MKILYVLKKDLDATEQKIVDEQKKSGEATVFDRPAALRRRAGQPLPAPALPPACRGGGGWRGHQ